MVQPMNLRPEARISLYDKDRKALVEVVVQDDDPARALARAIEMARVGQGGMPVVQDARAGMEPDQPVRPLPTYGHRPPLSDAARLLTGGKLTTEGRLPRRVLVTPPQIDVASTVGLGGSGGQAVSVGDGGVAVGDKGGRGGRVVVPPINFVDVDQVGQMTAMPFSGTAEMENCPLLVAHGPHAWRKAAEPDPLDDGTVVRSTTGELRDCPGQEVLVGGLATLPQMRTLATPAPTQATDTREEPEQEKPKPKPTERQCKNEKPHQSHVWRDSDVVVSRADGGYGEKVWCPGVEGDSEDYAS